MPTRRVPYHYLTLQRMYGLAAVVDVDVVGRMRALCCRISIINKMKNELNKIHRAYLRVVLI